MNARADLIAYGIAAASLTLVFVAGSLRHESHHAPVSPSPVRTEVPASVGSAPRKTKKVPAPKSRPKTAPAHKWPVRVCDENNWCWTYF